MSDLVQRLRDMSSRESNIGAEVAAEIERLALLVSTLKRRIVDRDRENAALIARICEVRSEVSAAARPAIAQAYEDGRISACNAGTPGCPRVKELEDELAARNWQPIETAPKDGTLVDLLAYGERWINCRSYRDDWVAERVNGPIKVFYVTHWMPLPKEPKP